MRHTWENRSIGNSARRLRLAGAIAVPAFAINLMCGSQWACGATEADWLSVTNGSWTTPALWSTNPNYPNLGNPAGSTYDAVIAAAGATYTVTENSAITLAGLTLNSSTATLSDNGSLEVDGSVSLQSGEFFLAGSLSNATITGTSGKFITQSAGSPVLSNITVGSGVNVQVNPTTVISNNLTFAIGSMSIGNGFADCTTTFSGTSQTIGGTGNILCNAGDLASIVANGTLSIASGMTLRGSTVQFTGGTLINNGIMTADGSVPVEGGQPQFLIAPSSFTNTGTLNVINGATLAIEPGAAQSGAWTNQGTINETNSTLLLDGTFSTSDLAGLTRNGGTVTLGGVLNNVGQTLALNSTTGVYSLTGVMNGGTVTDSGAGYLKVNGTLNGVTIAGSPGDPPVLLGQASLPLGLNLAGGNVQIGGFVTLGAALIGTGSIVCADPSGSLTLVSAPGVPLAIPVGINFSTIGTSPQYPTFPRLGTTSNAFSNAATITAQTPGVLLNVLGSSLTNTGTIQVINGGSLTLTGDLINNGTLIETNSTLNLAISDFTPAILPTIQRSGGEVNLAAAYDNTGITLSLTSTTGNLGLINGSTINGGAVTAAAGQKLYVEVSPAGIQPSGVLNGVTMSGSLVVEEQGTLDIQNNLTLQNSVVTMGTSIFPVLSAGGEGTLIQFEGNGHLAGTGQVLFQTTFVGDQINADVQSSLTIDPGITIQSDTAGGYIGSRIFGVNTPPVINNGLISSQTSGKTISIIGAPFTNQNTITATNGGILSITDLVNSGAISVSGSELGLAGNIVNQGTISMDHGAAIAAVGNFSQLPAGDLDFVLLGPPSGNGALFTIPSGSANLDGQLSIDLGGGYVPDIGTTWTLISATSVNGTFAVDDFPNTANRTFEVQYSPTSVTLTVLPEPGSIALVLLGASGILMRRRRR